MGTGSTTIAPPLTPQQIRDRDARFGTINAPPPGGIPSTGGSLPTPAPVPAPSPPHTPANPAYNPPPADQGGGPLPSGIADFLASRGIAVPARFTQASAGGIVAFTSRASSGGARARPRMFTRRRKPLRF